jgi:hypothetical protein
MGKKSAPGQKIKKKRNMNAVLHILLFGLVVGANAQSSFLTVNTTGALNVEGDFAVTGGNFDVFGRTDLKVIFY